VLAAKANERLIGATMQRAKEARRFAGLDLPADLARKIKLLQVGLVLPAPSDAEQRSELTRIAAEMEAIYGSGKYCPGRGTGDAEAADQDAPPGDDEGCLDLEELSNILAESRDPAKLQDAWMGWRTVSPAMRDEFVRYVIAIPRSDCASAGASLTPSPTIATTSPETWSRRTSAVF
jgi:peptidyl-dipeptidase A